MNTMKEVFKFGGMEVQYHLDRTDTNNQLSMFKCIIGAGAKMAVPHYHEHFDEVVYGLKGITTYIVNGKTIDVGPGTHLFISRGDVHGFVNKSNETVEFLAIATPAVFGPEYFRDVEQVFNAGGPPDLVKLGEVLKKHGLVPVPMEH